MKIQGSYTQSFGSKKLYCAKLSQKLNPEIKKDVFISELEPSDEKRVDDSLSQWKGSEYGCPILEDFLFLCHFAKFKIGNDVKFFAVEDLSEPTQKQFKTLMLAEPVKNNVYVSKFQSHTETDFENPLKGAGSCTMYAVIKLAQDMGKNSVSLVSTPKAQGFYHKIGMLQPFAFVRNFTLHKKDFQKVLSDIQDKYSISDINI